MRTNEERIRRLEWWNRGLLGLISMALAAGAVYNLRYRFESRHRTLFVAWQPTGEIRFMSTSDGPFVITHLFKTGADEGDKAVALLTRPLAIVDSRGAVLNKEDVSRLRWTDIFGDAVAAPPAGTKIKALYHRPEVAAERSSEQ